MRGASAAGIRGGRGMMAVVWILVALLLATRWSESRAELVFQGRVGTSAMASNRMVRIWVPPGYSRSERARYPVLYLQDGQNMFASAGTNAASGWGSWQIDQMAEGLILSNRMAPIILVAVDSTPLRPLEYRGPAHRYTPDELAREVRRPMRPGDSSAYEAYRTYLIDELKANVDRRFRTLRGPSTTGLMGSSLGGLCSLAIAFDRPDVFGRVACLSGSLQIERETLLNQFRAATNLPSGMKVYLDTGKVDMGGGDDGKARTDALAGEFRRLGWRDGRDFQRFVDYDLLTPGRLLAAGLSPDRLGEAKRSQHNEFYWRRRAWRALEFLFPPPMAAPAAQ